MNTTLNTLPHDMMARITQKLSFKDTVALAGTSQAVRSECLSQDVLEHMHDALPTRPSLPRDRAGLLEARQRKLCALSNLVAGNALWQLQDQRTGGVPSRCVAPLCPPAPTLPSHVWSQASSLDGQHAAYGHETGVRLESRQGDQVRRTDIPGSITYSLAFAPNGRYLVAASGGGEGLLRLVDTETHQLARVFNPPSPWLASCAVSPDSEYVAASCGHGETWIYHHTQTAAPLLTVSSGGPLQFSPDGTKLRLAGSELDFGVAPQ